MPMLVGEGATEPVPISSLPGVVQHTRDTVCKAATEAAAAGVGGVMLYGVPQQHDATGSGAVDPDGILNIALRDVRSDVGEDVVVMSELCLDEFTDHGHCGVLDAGGRADNDATLDIYARMGVEQARAGTPMVGPSGMMDGQVGVIREVLDAAGYADIGILAYTAKYASAFYGPFREAVNSQLRGDRRTYQQDGANAREALRELALDLEEGADVVMVKPGLTYLDVLARIAGARADHPAAVAPPVGQAAPEEAVGHPVLAQDPGVRGPAVPAREVQSYPQGLPRVVMDEREPALLALAGCFAAVLPVHAGDGPT